MTQLILHSGGVPATFEELGGFELPPETSSYKPLGHQDLVRMATKRTRRELDYDGEMEWSHGVNKEGQQYFGVCKLTDLHLTEQQCLVMGLRNSYDKSMSGAVAYGGSMFVCDNLSFFGSLITVMRKHTTNIVRDLQRLFVEALENVIEDTTVHAEAIEKWQAIPCSQDDGYRNLGLMRGKGLLTPTITNNAFREWQNPRQEFFKDRNVFSLYNATTEAMKAVAPSRALKTYSGVHGFFTENIAA
jgi:hypothetical protein